MGKLFSRSKIDAADYNDPNLTADELVLAKMGYKQELRRGFNEVMNFTFCATAVSVISSLVILLSYGLTVGGPTVMVWGWYKLNLLILNFCFKINKNIYRIVGSIFTILIGLSMGEICSTYPSAGSVYAKYIKN